MSLGVTVYKCVVGNTYLSINFLFQDLLMNKSKNDEQVHKKENVTDACKHCKTQVNFDPLFVVPKASPPYIYKCYDCNCNFNVYNYVTITTTHIGSTGDT